MTNRCIPICHPADLARETWETGYRDTCRLCGYTVAIADDAWVLEPPGSAVRREAMRAWFERAVADGRVTVGTSVIAGSVLP